MRTAHRVRPLGVDRFGDRVDLDLYAHYETHPGGVRGDRTGGGRSGIPRWREGDRIALARNHGAPQLALTTMDYAYLGCTDSEQLDVWIRAAVTSSVDDLS